MVRIVDHFRFAADDGAQIAAWRLAPEGRPKAVVQIAHGMAEHMTRYERLGQALAEAGYAVFASDHRGHGASADIHGLGDFGPRGFPGVVLDMAALSHVARGEHPGAPFVLIGHSMGSFAAQLYLLDHGDDLAALVLSGTAAGDKLLEAIAAAGGGGGRLESYNAAFEPARTPFDWLSRDEAEVDAYVADPLCGFQLTEASLKSVFEVTAGATLDPKLAKAPKDLPVLVISGERDPVTGPGQAFANVLVSRYREGGLDIEHRVYPEGRHELFNETNRDEVTADLIAWLDDQLHLEASA